MKEWTVNNKISYCVTGLNGNIVLEFEDSALNLQPEISTAACPAGWSSIVPGVHINQPAALPYMLLLPGNR